MQKLTLKSFFAFVATNPFEIDTFSADEVQAFAEKQVADIDKQYARRAEKRAEKRGDEKNALADAVFAVLTAEPMTLARISARLADNDITASVQKLAPLMKELADNGKVNRTSVDKRVAYSLI